MHIIKLAIYLVLCVLKRILSLNRDYQQLHNRSALLGDARQDDGRTPSPSYYQNNAQQQSVKLNMGDRDLDHLESQNDDEISGLSAKVKILKSVSLLCQRKPLVFVLQVQQ